MCNTVPTPGTRTTRGLQMEAIADVRAAIPPLAAVSPESYTAAQLAGHECAVCGTDGAYVHGDRPYAVTTDGQQLNACAPACDVTPADPTTRDIQVEVIGIVRDAADEETDPARRADKYALADRVAAVVTPPAPRLVSDSGTVRLIVGPIAEDDLPVRVEQHGGRYTITYDDRRVSAKQLLQLMQQTRGGR